MNATSINPSAESGYNTSLVPSVAISFMLHIAVIVLATLGLPYVMREPIDMEQAITVEIADLAEISQTNKVAPPEEKQEEEPAPAEAKPVYNNTESAPDLLTPQPPDIVEEIPEPPVEKKEPEVVEKQKPPPPKPKVKPNRPKPKPPAPDKPKEEPKEPQKDITSLLRSLTPDEPDTPSESLPQETPSDQGQQSQIANLTQNLTRSEEDDLNRGVQPCWNVNAGGKMAEELIVSLQVSVNPDMSVRDVKILDQGRYNQDTHFRAAADAARRALINPRCSTLRLPPEKYDRWKVFIYHFDPSHML